MAVGAARATSAQVSGPTVPDVTVELLSPASMHPGDTVDIAIRVRNAGARPVELELPGRPVAFDVVIRGTGGEPVWRRLRGGAMAGILALLRLAPGEAHDFSVRWPGTDEAGTPVPPGGYTVQGMIPINGVHRTTDVASLVVR